MPPAPRDTPEPIPLTRETAPNESAGDRPPLPDSPSDLEIAALEATLPPATESGRDPPPRSRPDCA